MSQINQNTNSNLKSKKVHRYVSNDFTLRMSAVDATEVVQEMQKIQKPMPLATLGVGRAMVGALLMASSLKDDQEVGLLFKGNGPLASIYAEASFNGHVRGFCPQPNYEAPQKIDYLNLGKALGNGTLSVARHQPFQKQPHHGTVQLVSGEIGDDIAHYLEQSHQIRSLISLGVYLDEYGKVRAAGGILIEVMPGVEESVVEKLFQNYNQYKGQVSKTLFEGGSELDIIKPYLNEIPFTQIPHDFPISYFCPCTIERVINALGVLGEQGLDEIIQEGKDTEMTCQICGRTYQIPVEKVDKLRSEIRRNSMH